MFSLLRKKYGKPKTYNTRIVQNRMNAKFQAFSALWKIKGCELFLGNSISEVDDGYLLITTEKWRKHEKEEQRKKEKQALDKL